MLPPLHPALAAASLSSSIMGLSPKQKFSFSQQLDTLEMPKELMHLEGTLGYYPKEIQLHLPTVAISSTILSNAFFPSLSALSLALKFTLRLCIAGNEKVRYRILNIIQMQNT